MHVFVISRKTIRFYMIQVAIWTMSLCYFVHVLVTALRCLPVNQLWDPTVPGHCFIDQELLGHARAIFNVVSDICILVMPVVWVWELQLIWKRKLGVCLIFASGILLVSRHHANGETLPTACSACISSIMRLVDCIRWGTESDATWYLPYNGLWT